LYNFFHNISPNNKNHATVQDAKLDSDYAINNYQNPFSLIFSTLLKTTRYQLFFLNGGGGGGGGGLTYLLPDFF
jgi:hypothetical protein